MTMRVIGSGRPGTSCAGEAGARATWQWTHQAR